MNYWNQKSIPHKGWINQGYEDLEEATHVCDMCGKEEIRYVHTMYHPEVAEYFKVGEVCAGKMTNDYNTPKEQLKSMKSKSSWMTKNWAKTDLYEYQEKQFNSLYGRIQVGIFKCENKYMFHVDDKINVVKFESIKQAKEFIYSVYKIP